VPGLHNLLVEESTMGIPRSQWRGRRLLFGVAAALAAGLLAVGTTAALAGPEQQGRRDTLRLQLTPSQPALAACMPDARLEVTIRLAADTAGFDTLEVQAKDLPPNRDYTVFLLETAGPPFGAAEYIGDFSTNPAGNGRNTFRLIVEEAFASTLVNGARVRVDLNRIGVWFADPKDDDFCQAANGINNVTPFDGDNQAGVQAFNSANADPLPAP
jgi:hypothetical protein